MLLFSSFYYNLFNNFNAARLKYIIKNWIALNQENFKKYKRIESMKDRISFLESILTANIISFAKGIEWTIEKPIELNIIDILKTNEQALKGVKVMGFDIKFATNVFLPNFIGLGKSVSLGYGVIKQLTKDNGQ
jgi:hypothetical protein